MSTEDVSQDIGKRFKSLLSKRKKLRKQIQSIEKEMFKYETVYLEMTQGSPLTRNVEYYVSNRTDKKKHNVDDRMRIFNKNFPRVD
ncbi:histone acetyltransferase subunit NuA4-like protein [Encephalitozoon hellem ATCC 50504]|uniref:Chromatin modification-related protein EAF6 n=1 Tax=Encephalitozoon hellem TaxID=27973 RepID=A0A9Q9C538_ENCHE|nr:histone acetyltransferase subunit NuA4-like protein [Encephalitozoon hellem ATCC 50504]AHL28976.1 histone acetyltransferase subunit NuA4-like protein [Encephalitozoon hellem ATCC 50504]UTX44324.1 hypothetical protein GPU96_11g21230 [Encephalitozoon hellem]WEL39824.1 histone acetyltransferase subunit NuA4-like protein [Encephalitozoon hellem]